jgi:DNA-binding beta-propeller fold protein YncE
VASGSAVIAGLGLAGCGGGHAATSHGVTAADVSFQHVPGPPFGVATTSTGHYAFVDVVGGNVLVYSTDRFAPQLIRTIHASTEAVGSSLTRDGRLLLIAGGQGATVVSVARAEDGALHPVLGRLSPPPAAHLRASGAIETASSSDGRYVFVSLEYGAPGGAIAVYDLGSTSDPHFGPADYVGAITLGSAVVGSALSPDGRYLYVTSEVGRQSRSQRRARQALRRRLLQPRSGSSASGGTAAAKPHASVAAGEQMGTLSVISVAAAERQSAHAVLATVPALYQPVRVAVSPDGSVVWVTARASNRLLAFSAAKLLTDPTRALLATVKVGTSPVGVAVFDHGKRVITADSARFDATGAHASLTVVDAPAALAHRSAVIATVRSGSFPRELAVESGNNVVLVGNFASDQLEAVNVSNLR